jgi:phenylalanyl-tRNA synthetase beta chain
VDEVSHLLTMSGLEVEKIEQFCSIEGGLDGLVIGEVMEKSQHPDADRLSCTKVNVGGDTLLDIVCGAPNIDAGQKVVVATVGTTLYSDGESFKIKKSKIRGQVSEGMICAEDEIGLGESHDGIMVLDTSAKVGTPAKEFFNIENDEVIEIGLTPNRSDAMSHIGVARDLRAVLRHFDKIEDNKEVVWPDVTAFAPEVKESPVSIEVKDTDACLRYVGLTIESVSVSESPEWLKNRLLAIGLRPINNVVDITNYVLHELGQPLHAFDMAAIKGNKVVVRRTEQGKKFTTLDEVERTLDGNDLMICNESEGMCIAGVFGGIGSGVTEKTTDIFLESAFFNPVSIRKSSKRHGLNTDASFRFERGVDPDITVYAAKRAALLIQELAGGKISTITDIYPKPIERFRFEVRFSRINEIVGHEIPREAVRTILKDLDVFIEKEREDVFKVSVPPFKSDVTREIDIIEEVLRVYGYDHVPMQGHLKMPLVHETGINKEELKGSISNMMSANGFAEIMNNSLTKAAYVDEMVPGRAENSVKILNPLSSDLNAMRQSLVFGGLETIARNINRQRPNLKLYEFGNLYFKTDGQDWPYHETEALGVFVTGKWNSGNWSSSEEDSSFHHLKSSVQLIFNRLGLKYKVTDLPEDMPEMLNYGLQFTQGKKVLAQIGSVNSKWCDKFDIEQEVFHGFILWNEVLSSLKQGKSPIKDLPKYPSVRRDLAMLVSKEVQFGAMEKIAKQADQKLLKEVDLFDVYEGKGVPDGKRSYALSFILQDENSTLNDKVIDKTMNRIQAALEKEVGAELRG